MKKSAAMSAVLGAALVVLLGGCGATSATGGSPAASTPAANAGSSSAEPSDTPESESPSSEKTFVNGVLTTPDLKIVINRYKVIKAGQKGNEYGDKPVIAFWYSTTRLGDKDVDPSTAWLFNFEAYQDNNPNAENKLEVGTLPDDAYLDSQMETIKKGGTVKNAVSYELDDLKTPVDLVAGSMFGDDEIGRMTYPVK